MTDSMNRRAFLQLTAAAAAMLGLSSYPGVSIAADPEVRKPRPIEQGKKIRIAQIGFAGKGSSDIRSLVDNKDVPAEVVALCDVDWTNKNVLKVFQSYPQAKRYKDFRKMLLEMDDQIDAVCISTPDHMHFLPAYMAISMGKHIYIQKPMTQTIWEAQQLLELARKHGVCTQMGNQGHCGEGCRLVKEWVSAGVLGPVKNIEVWTNRPVWPQGMTSKPEGTPLPKGMAWDQYIGRAPMRPFSSAIHPFKWRGFADFGSGALGDMGCHLLDAPFFALNLGDAKTVTFSAETSGPVNDAFPSWAVINFEFSERGDMPACKLTWRDGGKMPERPKELEASRKLAKGGLILYGEKATVYDGNDYCNSPRVIPEAKMKEIQPKLPAKTIRRATKNSPYIDFLEAIQKGDPKWSATNFEYAVPLTVFVLMGNLAMMAPGKKIVWDNEKMEVVNLPELNKYLKPTFREGWQIAELTDKAKWAPVDETQELDFKSIEADAKGKKGKGGKKTGKKGQKKAQAPAA